MDVLDKKRVIVKQNERDEYEVRLPLDRMAYPDSLEEAEAIAVKAYGEDILIIHVRGTYELL